MVPWKTQLNKDKKRYSWTNESRTNFFKKQFHMHNHVQIPFAVPTKNEISTMHLVGIMNVYNLIRVK